VLPERHRIRQVPRIANAVIAAVACGLLLIVLGAGYGTVPGLGPGAVAGPVRWELRP
jgi:hypothetical protein